MKTTKQFIEEAKLIHGNEYDYCLVEYKDNKTKVRIVCKKCGTIFELFPKHHLNFKYGCPFCKEQKSKIQLFLEKLSCFLKGGAYDRVRSLRKVG